MKGKLFILISAILAIGAGFWLIGAVRNFNLEMEEYGAVKIERPVSQLKTILLDVPFASQAPFGQWEDIIFQNACEEATILMAMNWIEGKIISKEQAVEEIRKITDFEDENYGPAKYDLSIQDTAQLIIDYWGYKNVSVSDNISAIDIIRELRRKNLVIVAVNGQKLGNPFYTQPGPLEHMLLIKGYDFKTNEFITNDTGTRHGENFRYKKDVLENAVRDYPTGYKEPIREIKKTMIIISQEK